MVFIVYMKNPKIIHFKNEVHLKLSKCSVIPQMTLKRVGTFEKLYTWKINFKKARHKPKARGFYVEEIIIKMDVLKIKLCSFNTFREHRKS